MNRNITAEDIHNFKFVHEPAFSPNGKEILFAVTQTSGDEGYATSVWKYSFDRGLVSLFFNSRKISSLRWASDGSKFLYLTSSTKGDSNLSELWVANSDGLERKCILALQGRLMDPHWSSDGRDVFFVSDYDSDLQSNSDFTFVTRMNYRFDGDGVYGDKFTHIFKVGIDSKMRRLTQGNFDVTTIDVAPDGKSIAFVSNKDQDADFEVNLDVYTISTEGDRVAKLTNNKGPISTISYSPDGKYIAFAGDDYRSKFNTPAEVWLLEIANKKTFKISGELDRPVYSSIIGDSSLDNWTFALPWSADSNIVYFTATDGGTCNVYAANIHSRVTQITTGKHVVTSISVSKDGKLAFVKMDPAHLSELYVLQNEETLQVSNFNGSVLSSLKLSQPNEFKFKASDGVEVSAFFYPPTTDYGNDKPSCVVKNHGGGGTEGYEFSHEFQCLCAQGFAVLTCNFRGTKGYGESFMRVLTGHYMEKDYSDIIDATKHAISSGWIDPKKLGVTGGSYGGYLTNWIIGHTDMFSAAVTDRSVVNLYSFYGTSDDYRLIEEDVQQSLPWDKPEYYFEKSPIAYVKNIKTPLLIIHSEEDYRCRIEQAEQLYSFLKRLKREVAFVRFPDESHGLSRGGKPHHRIERLRFILWWFTSHIETGRKVQRPQ